MMTPEREAEIRARCERATPEPWRPGRADMQSYDGLTGEAFTNIYTDNPRGQFHLGERLPLTIARALDESGRNKQDADFIAHARQDIPDLLEALCEARQKLRALEDGLEKWREAAERNREIDEAQYRGW